MLSNMDAPPDKQHKQDNNAKHTNETEFFTKNRKNEVSMRIREMKELKNTVTDACPE